jgi:hypothetical protein
MDTQYDSIQWYLSNTASLKSYREKFKSLQGEEYWVVPWDSEIISYNSGVTIEFLLDFVSKNHDLSMEEEEIGSIKHKILKGQIKDSPVVKAELPQMITVKNLMNLIIFLYVREQQKRDNAPVKMEDALFFLKNSAMIPDDFMPEHLMGNVEGSMAINSEILRKEFQFLPGKICIFLFLENTSARYSKVRYLFTPESLRLNEDLEVSTLIDKLKGSFSELQADPRYQDFEDSRLLKTLIYQIEVRKNREVKKPFFTPEKVERLIQLGIPVIDSKIPEKISANEIKSRKENKMNSGISLAQDWFTGFLNIH